MTKNLMIVGVGGQGTLLASRLLGAVAQNAGYDVKVSEVHGMSQRGGTVVTYVRYGDRVYSPIVEQGEADYIVAFEVLEAARFLPYLKKDGLLLSNTQQIAPMPVITGAMEYPKNLLEKIAKQADLLEVDALAAAKEAGNPRALNIVLMGVLSTRMEFAEEAWLSALRSVVKPQYLAVNETAFLNGRKLGYAAL